MKKSALEPKLGKEPTVQTALETTFELFLHILHQLLLLGWISLLFGSQSFVERELDEVASWHQVLVVVHLQERLHTSVASTTLFGHVADDFAWITIDTGNQSMAERLVGASFIEVLDDHGFATSETSVHDENDAVWLQDLDHFDFCVVLVVGEKVSRSVAKQNERKNKLKLETERT